MNFLEWLNVLHDFWDNVDWIELMLFVVVGIIGFVSGHKSEKELTSGLFVPQRDKETEPIPTAGFDAKGENSQPVTIIRNMGIQYKLLDDGRCIFTYQGDHLYIDYSDDPRFFRIVDLRWFGVPADDIDKVSLVQKAINICNTGATCKLVYNIDKEENSLDVSSMRDMFLPTDMKEAEEYMRITLDVLLHTHQTFYGHLGQIRQEEFEAR